MGKVLNYKHFIDGSWVGGESAEVMNIINPANMEVVAEVAKGTVGDVDRAVVSARNAFESGVWSGRSLEERTKVLLKAASLAVENNDRLAYLESLTSGAAIRRTSNLDVNAVSSYLEVTTKIAARMPKVEKADIIPQSAIPMNSYFMNEPIGVCVGITPWNFPLVTAIFKIAPALTMGNTIVMKPASTTPVTTLELAKILSDAGLPDGVLNVVTGPGGSIGDHIAAHPEVDKIGFTGSTEVGIRIAEIAARSVKRVTLELGGKSPVIILDDADIETAANMSMLAFCAHQGQICISGTRVFVPRHMQDELVSRLITKIKALKIGDPLDPATVLGAISNEAQLRTVLEYVDIGKKEGAELAYGGTRITEGALAKGLFVTPAVFMNCNNNMRQVREEIFGPVQCVIPYDDLDEAIALANDTSYGLAAGICSTNSERAQKIASKIRAGTIFINTYHIFRPDAPFGGYKQSGLGREGSYYSLMAYSEAKHVCQNLSSRVDCFGMLGDF